MSSLLLPLDGLKKPATRSKNLAELGAERQTTHAHLLQSASGCRNPKPMCPPSSLCTSVADKLLPLRKLCHRLVVGLSGLRPLLGLAVHGEICDVLEELVSLCEGRLRLVVVPVERRALRGDVLHVEAHRVQLQGHQALEILRLLALDELRHLLQALEGLVEGNLLPVEVHRVVGLE